MVMNQSLLKAGLLSLWSQLELLEVAKQHSLRSFCPATTASTMTPKRPIASPVVASQIAVAHLKEGILS